MGQGVCKTTLPVIPGSKNRDGFAICIIILQTPMIISPNLGGGGGGCSYELPAFQR